MKKTLCCLVCFLPLMACAPDFNADDYTTDIIGHESTAEPGVIVYKRNIKMRYNDERGAGSGVGTGATLGGTTGAIAGISGGNSLGSGVIGGLIGAGIGAAVGYGVDHSTRTSDGIEYHVKMNDTKKIVIIVQGVKPAIKTGAKVFVIKPKNNETHLTGSKQMRARIIPAPY